MRIFITAEVCSEKKWFPILDVLLMLVEEGRHSISDENLEDLLGSPWLSDGSYSARELVRSSLVSESYDADANRSRVVIDARCRRGGVCEFADGLTRLHPLDAVMFLSTPFQVVVENENFDGAFILWMARAVGYTKLVDAYRSGKFIFRHAGGKGSIVRSAKIFSDGVWAREDNRYKKAFRFWLCAVLDNDSRFPGDRPNASLVEEARAHTSFVHELRKRSIESYIPRTKLTQFDSSLVFKNKLDALFRLCDVQRLHFHMKKGFRFGQAIKPSKQEFMSQANLLEKQLFSSVSESDWLEISEGFGGGLSRVYTEPQFRPVSVDKESMDKADIAEMLSLAKSIYQRI